MNDFLAPEKLKEIFKALEENVSDPDFIRKPEYNFLKEIWCALESKNPHRNQFLTTLFSSFNVHNFEDYVVKCYNNYRALWERRK